MKLLVAVNAALATFALGVGVSTAANLTVPPNWEANCQEGACTADCSPVCGSDGRSYGNLCDLALHKCKNRSLELASQGPCPGHSQWAGCGDNGSGSGGGGAVTVTPPIGGAGSGGNGTGSGKNDTITKPNAPGGTNKPQASSAVTIAAGASSVAVALVVMTVASLVW